MQSSLPGLAAFNTPILVIKQKLMYISVNVIEWDDEQVEGERVSFLFY